MNFLSVVRHITTPQAVKDEEEAKEKASLLLKQYEEQEAQQHYDVWFAMPQSKNLLGALTNAYNYYIQRAKDLAAEGNKDTSALLIQATTIEKVIKYVRTREPIVPSDK